MDHGRVAVSHGRKSSADTRADNRKTWRPHLTRLEFTLYDAWGRTGNAGTTSGTHFLGTTDHQPLELKVNGWRVLRLEPTGLHTANIIGGSSGNYVATGLDGVTIAGGGVIDDTLSLTNSILAGFASIGGGVGNTIGTGSQSATIPGGGRNEMQLEQLVQQLIK